MKRLALLLLLLFAPQSFAQMMVIHRSGLPDVTIPIADIAKITFDSLQGSGVSHFAAVNKIKTIFAKVLPNPINTKIEYSVAKSASAKIRVFDMQGRVVRTILDQRMEPGRYTTLWNSCNDAGQRVGSAPYIVHIEIGGESFSKTLVLAN